MKYAIELPTKSLFPCEEKTSTKESKPQVEDWHDCKVQDKTRQDTHKARVQPRNQKTDEQFTMRNSHPVCS